MNILEKQQTPQEEHQIIKPEVKISLLLASTFFLPFFLTLFFGTQFWFIAAEISAAFATIAVFVAFLLFWMFLFIMKKVTLDNTEYKFYTDRIEYYEGFLTKNRKTIKFDRISNVGQRRGIIERLYGLGTVYIDTPGSSQKGHELTMRYMGNPDGIYDFIVGKTQKNQA